MSEHTEDTIKEEQESKPATLPGHRLKHTREDLHLTKDEVAHHLHLDVRIVEALESDNYTELPSAAYICGYLRSYARILKLPEDEIVNAYSRGHEINAALIPESVSMEPDKGINPAIFKPVFIIALLVIIAVVLVWLAQNLHIFDVNTVSESTTIEVPVPEESGGVIERPAQIQEQIHQYNAETSAIDQIKQSGANIDPAVSSDANNPDKSESTQISDEPLLIDESSTVVNSREVQPQKKTGDLKLVYTADCWTEVTDAEGERQVYRLAGKGSEIYVDGKPPFKILLGNADGVEVYYKKKLFNHKRYQRDEIAYFRLGKAE